MRLRQIEIIHAVYQHGSISAAARALGISQPSVSKMLRHAEEGARVTLFNLVRGRLVPTNEAHALMREAGDLFERLASLQQTARNLSTTGPAHIKLGVVPSLALDILPRAMARFRRTAPRVSFEVHTYHHDDLVRSLVERETEIAIAYEPPAHPRLAQTTLAEGEMVVFFPKGVFNSTSARLPLEALADRELIGVRAAGPIGEALARAMRERSMTVRETVSVQTFFIAARLAELEHGITIIDEFTARVLRSSDFDCLPLDPPLKFTITCVTLESNPPSQAARQFLRALDVTLREI